MRVQVVPFPFVPVIPMIGAGQLEKKYFVAEVSFSCLVGMNFGGMLGVRKIRSYFEKSLKRSSSFLKLSKMSCLKKFSTDFPSTP